MPFNTTDQEMTHVTCFRKVSILYLSQNTGKSGSPFMASFIPSKEMPKGAYNQATTTSFHTLIHLYLDRPCGPVVRVPDY
jgi:hypothetical protein